QQHLGLIGEYLDTAHEARPAAVSNHGAQACQRAIDSRRADGARFHGAELVRACLEIADVSAVQVKLGTITILPRLARYDRDVVRRVDLADAAQSLGKDRPLGRELIVVSRVLVMTTAAAPEVRAGRGHAL